jgi:hypothetical protein
VTIITIRNRPKIQFFIFVYIISLLSCAPKNLGIVTDVVVDLGANRNPDITVFLKQPGLFLSVKFESKKIDSTTVFLNSRRDAGQFGRYFLLFKNKSSQIDSVELFTVEKLESNFLSLEKKQSKKLLFVADGVHTGDLARESNISISEMYCLIKERSIQLKAHCKKSSCFKISLNKSSWSTI